MLRVCAWWRQTNTVTDRFSLMYLCMETTVLLSWVKASPWWLLSKVNCRFCDWTRPAAATLSVGTGCLWSGKPGWSRCVLPLWHMFCMAASFHLSVGSSTTGAWHIGGALPPSDPPLIMQARYFSPVQWRGPKLSLASHLCLLGHTTLWYRI